MTAILDRIAFPPWTPAALALGCIAFAGMARAATPPAMEQGLLCRSAVRQAEAGSALPPYLLAGIARVESGRRDPVSGRFHPWPWSINAQGRDSVFDTKAEAIAFARQLQTQGIRSFDVGCMQINLMYHPDAFQSLDEAFDPVANARYAVKFLGQLHDQTGSWETASAWYHSANPEEGLPYRSKVVTAMAEEARLPFAASDPAAAQPSLFSGGYPVRSMPARPANVMMLAGSSRGSILLQPTGAGAQAPAGRGLDSYRLQPVSVTGRHMASR